MKGICPLAALFASCAVRAATFEVVALVDSLDYAKVFDVETREGNLQILDYVLSNGVTAVWWRDKGGGLVRYPSREESCLPSQTPFVRTRLPDASEVYGSVRLDGADADAFPLVFAECDRRHVSFGIHTTFEENHWLNSLCSNWNLVHPQFWCKRRGGVPWSGHCSLAYPEVLQHKMALVDERLSYNPQTIFCDLYRCGGWGPDCEFTRPMLARWRGLYGETALPLPDDPRWLDLVSESVESYLRSFAAKCHAKRCTFGIGCYGFDGRNDVQIHRWHAVDWQKLAEEKIVDYVVVMGVKMDPKDPWASTERIYRDVMSRCGRAKVYFTVSAYTYQSCCLSGYAKSAGVCEKTVASRLVSLAKSVGGAGVVLECLDYGNYSPEVMKAILTAGLEKAR